MSASPGDMPVRPDAVRQVQKRLTRDFGGVPVPVIEEVVRRWVRSFAGARVTQYLPILIERASRDELSRLAADPAQGRVGGDGRSHGTAREPAGPGSFVWPTTR
jgi:hypothetical protein